MSTFNTVRRIFVASLIGASALAAGEAQAVIIPNNVSGRFIKLENNGPATRILHTSEIEAFNGGVAPIGGLDGVNDFALISKGASFEAESFTDTFSGATHGSVNAPIDGVPSDGAGTYSRTNAGFYMLDLGQTRDIGRIRVWQRPDGCCQDRLQNVTVSLLADNAGVPGAVVGSQSFAGQVPSQSFQDFFVAQGSLIAPGGVGVIGTDTVGLAKFVQVINNGNVDRLLAIGELEAFASGVPAGPNGNTPGNFTSLNNPNDLARSAAGATIFSASTSGGHGVPGSVIDGLEQQGADVWTKQNPGGGAQITVGLASSTEIGTVRVHQRNDGCCQERLSDFTVNLFADNGSGAPGALVGSQSFPGQATTDSFAQLNFATQFTIGANDVLQIEINGTTGLADLLSVGTSGLGQLVILPGATLQIIGLGTLAGGQTFDILNFGSVVGSFTNIIAPQGLITTNLLTNGTVSTALLPEPGTIGLALLGALALARRRRVA